LNSAQIILDKNLNEINRIQLNHLNKDFTLAFTSTSYLNKLDNQFRYKLHGYDDEWIESKKRYVNYTNLSPGKYVFEVFAANNDGFWCAQPTRLSIVVKPSPFLSVWAIVIYILLITVAFFQVRRFILARIRLRNELVIERVKRDKDEKFHEERIRFYTNISHELRTPLTLIMGPIKQLISENPGAEEQKRLHQFIANNSQRLLSLVNQLLDFRKSIYEGMKLKTTHCDLINIVESNIDAFKFMSEEKAIITNYSTKLDAAIGWFDQEKLDLILFNILSNAYKYTPRNGQVNVNVSVNEADANLPASHVAIAITNTGKGIARDQQTKVFNRFYQVNDNERKNNTGTGIGLSLVHSMVELHHGKITLESEVGVKTCFTILLPFGDGYYDPDEIFDFKNDADRRTKELLKHSQSDSAKVLNENRKEPEHKLLLVEDNFELREFIQGYLSHEYQVFTAKDGVEGVEVCKRHNPDIIVSDIMMDNMDGIEFCKLVKTNPEISHIPVILMTALTSVEKKIEGYKIGADDFITKPFEPQLLKIRIENILQNVAKLKKCFRHDLAIGVKELTISKLDEDLLNRVIKLTEHNLDNVKFGKDMMCKELSVSYSYLYRKIKNITGTSPTDFVQSYRLKKAAQMLMEKQLNVSEIAYSVGYNDALYFSKCFKKQFGVAPSKYLG
jgi:signal transduction histidine kinase/DNA-binding response OmpR family regulator